MQNTVVDMLSGLSIHSPALPVVGFTVLFFMLAIVCLRRRKKKKRTITIDVERLTSRIIGQDRAIREIVSSMTSACKDPSRGRRPRFLCFIAGPTGVGKTEFVKILGEAMNLPVYVFNMSDYMGEGGRDASSAHWRLFGSAIGYVDSEKAGEFIRAVQDNRPCIILLDEIEKANKRVLDTFLTAFQEGFVRSNRGEEYSITNTFIFCTSNACQDVHSEINETSLRRALLSEGFKKEFLARFDKVVAFRAIDEEAAGRIFLQRLMDEFKGKVEYEERALNELLREYGFEEFGARAVLRLLTERIHPEIRNRRNLKRIVISSKPQEVSTDTYLIVTGSAGRGYLQMLGRLHDVLSERVLGQEKPIREVCRILKSRAIGVTANPGRPQGVFFMVGPTGVGKTELVKAVAEALSRPFVRFDMGEFKHRGAAQRFFGSPPGYVGSDKGGHLTSAVIRHPNAVILLDEAEKADPEIWDTFLPVFDDGRLTDASSGTVVRFGETIIFMTSNLEVDCSGGDPRKALFDAGYFRAEFVNRLDAVLCFSQIDVEIARKIVRQKIDRILESVRKRTGVTVRYTDEIVDHILDMADFRRFGARNIEKTAEIMLGDLLYEFVEKGEKNLLIEVSNGTPAVRCC